MQRLCRFCSFCLIRILLLNLNVMIWDGFVQLTGKYCPIRHMECPESQTGISGRMESAPDVQCP